MYAFKSGHICDWVKDNPAHWWALTSKRVPTYNTDIADDGERIVGQPLCRLVAQVVALYKLEEAQGISLGFVRFSQV